MDIVWDWIALLLFCSQFGIRQDGKKDKRVGLPALRMSHCLSVTQSMPLWHLSLCCCLTSVMSVTHCTILVNSTYLYEVFFLAPLFAKLRFQFQQLWAKARADYLRYNYSSLLGEPVTKLNA